MAPSCEEVVLVGEPLAGPEPELAEADLTGVAAEAGRVRAPQPVLHRVDGQPVQVLVAHALRAITGNRGAGPACASQAGRLLRHLGGA